MEAWNGALESKGLRVNIKKTKMKINSENAGQVTVEDKFPYAVCRKGVGSNSILSQFCRCWKHRGKLKKDCKFKFQTYANQKIDVAEDC